MRWPFRRRDREQAGTAAAPSEPQRDWAGLPVLTATVDLAAPALTPVLRMPDVSGTRPLPDRADLTTVSSAPRGRVTGLARSRGTGAPALAHRARPSVEAEPEPDDPEPDREPEHRRSVRVVNRPVVRRPVLTAAVDDYVGEAREPLVPHRTTDLDRLLHQQGGIGAGSGEPWASALAGYSSSVAEPPPRADDPQPAAPPPPDRPHRRATLAQSRRLGLTPRSTPDQLAQAEPPEPPEPAAEDAERHPAVPETPVRPATAPVMVQHETTAPATEAPDPTAPATAAPTASRPTTIVPTNSPLATTAPTTAPPTTAPAITPAPTIKPPTIKPSTIAPDTIVPSTIAPESIEPESVAPEFIVPEFIAPETDPPAAIAPASAEPVIAGFPGVAPAIAALRTAAPAIDPPTTSTHMIDPYETGSHVRAKRPLGLGAPLVDPPRRPVTEPTEVVGVPEDVTSAFRSTFGVDVGDVPVHRGGAVAERARTSAARAFTQHGQVYLPDDAGPLHEPETKALLAHELVHAVQQHAIGPALPAENSPAGAALEAEAVATERWFLDPGSAPTPLVHRPPTNPEPPQPTAPQRAPEVRHHEPPATWRLPDFTPSEPPDLAELRKTVARLENTVSTMDLKQPDPRELDDLANRVYRRVRGNLRRELLVDRERAGLLADL